MDQASVRTNCMNKSIFMTYMCMYNIIDSF